MESGTKCSYFSLQCLPGDHASCRLESGATIAGLAGPGLVGGAVADGFFGEEGLLAEAAGDFGEFALVGTDGGQVIGLADEIEGAEGFPDLFVAGVHGS